MIGLLLGLFFYSCSSHKIPTTMHLNCPFSNQKQNKNYGEGHCPSSDPFHSGRGHLRQLTASDCLRDLASFLDHFKHCLAQPSPSCSIPVLMSMIMELTRHERQYRISHNVVPPNSTLLCISFTKCHFLP